jgi:hypothetical protein
MANGEKSKIELARVPENRPLESGVPNVPVAGLFDVGLKAEFASTVPDRVLADEFGVITPVPSFSVPFCCVKLNP